ncbi:hypothetical protein ACLOJK_032179 [Asimina triloba]
MRTGWAFWSAICVRCTAFLMSDVFPLLLLFSLSPPNTRWLHGRYRSSLHLTTYLPTKPNSSSNILPSGSQNPSSFFVFVLLWSWAVNECLAEMIKYIANEPSVGLFYVQQHTQNAIPNLVHIKVSFFPLLLASRFLASVFVIQIFLHLSLVDGISVFP